jgi:anti-sigma regulatory factor (Ser/Thr protein kinase)
MTDVVAPLQLRLQARAEFAFLLRERVRVWLEEAQATEREIFEVLLPTNEAFANAVEHPHEPSIHLVDVEGTISERAVTISIRDYGTWQGCGRPEGGRRAGPGDDGGADGRCTGRAPRGRYDGHDAPSPGDAVAVRGVSESAFGDVIGCFGFEDE